ncbi:MAG: type II toxin-antitoxin system HicA family toxin [Bacteroidetes bacterium]|nr:MAG: type II toxin-antitoxin system HicA family toxin [Bacteroidota bacterium]
MKRNKLVKYLEKNGCTFVREGSRNTLFGNISNGKVSTVPRHPNIKENLCRKIYKDLAFPIS